MKVAIHQPNFMPSYAFFQKIEQSDTFVILGNCQYEKGGYQNRFNIGEKWYTMPVLNNGFETIKQKKYANAKSDFQKIIRSLQVDEDSKQDLFLKSLYLLVNESLYETNVNIIYSICDILRIDRDKICFDWKTNLTGSDRLLDICKHYGASTYISGSSGRKYLDKEMFFENNIDIVFQENQDYTPILKKL